MSEGQKDDKAREGAPSTDAQREREDGKEGNDPSKKSDESKETDRRRERRRPAKSKDREDEESSKKSKPRSKSRPKSRSKSKGRGDRRSPKRSDRSKKTKDRRGKASGKESSSESSSSDDDRKRRDDREDRRSSKSSKSRKKKPRKERSLSRDRSRGRSPRHPRIPEALRDSMYGRIAQGAEPDGESWDTITSELEESKKGGKGADKDGPDPSPTRHHWDIMKIQMEGYKTLRHYREGSSFSRWLAEFEDSLPVGTLTLKERIELLRGKLANPQQVMLKSAIKKLKNEEGTLSWNKIRTQLVKLVGGAHDAAHLTRRMRRAMQTEQETFRDWTNRVIEELSDVLGRQPEDDEILKVVVDGANEFSIRYIDKRGFRDLPSLMDQMDKLDQHDRDYHRRFNLRPQSEVKIPPLEGDNQRKRAKPLETCGWCSKAGHDEESCRADKYCDICLEDTHARRNCENYKAKKAAEKAAQAEEKSKLEALQLEPEKPDPQDKKGKGQRQRTRKPKNQGDQEKSADAAFAEGGGHEESRLEWQGRSRGRGRGRGNNRGGGNFRGNNFRGKRGAPPPPDRVFIDPFQDGKCRRCGDDHDFKNCRHSEKECGHCGIVGHLKKRCWKLHFPGMGKQKRGEASSSATPPRVTSPPQPTPPPAPAPQQSQMQAPYQAVGGGHHPYGYPYPPPPPYSVYPAQPMPYPVMQVQAPPPPPAKERGGRRILRYLP